MNVKNKVPSVGVPQGYVEPYDLTNYDPADSKRVTSRENQRFKQQRLPPTPVEDFNDFYCKELTEDSVLAKNPSIRTRYTTIHKFHTSRRLRKITNKVDWNEFVDSCEHIAIDPLELFITLEIFKRKLCHLLISSI